MMVASVCLEYPQSTRNPIATSATIDKSKHLNMMHDRVQHPCTGSCCFLPRAWAMKKIYSIFPVNRPLPTRLAISFLRHPRSQEVRAWEHMNSKQRHFTCCVCCYSTVQILYLELLGRIGDIGLQLINSTYLILADCFTPSNLRLVSKQLVSEFLQDALSTNMTQWLKAGWHCFCQKTFLGAA